MADHFQPLDALRRMRDVDKRAAGLLPRSVAVFTALVLRSDGGGESYPSHACLAGDTGLDEKTVRAALKDLERVGLVVVVERGRQHVSNRYRISTGTAPALPVVQRGSRSPSVDSSTGVAPVAERERLPSGREWLPSQSGSGSRGSAQLTAHELPIEGLALRAAVVAPLELTSKGETKPARKREPKHTNDEIAAKRRIVDFFVATLARTKGVEPETIDLTHAGDHAAAFALAKYGADEASTMIARALSDAWVLEHNPTLRYIASKPDAWRGTAPAKAHANGARHGVQRGQEPGFRCAGDDT